VRVNEPLFSCYSPWFRGNPTIAAFSCSSPEQGGALAGSVPSTMAEELWTMHFRTQAPGVPARGNLRPRIPRAQPALTRSDPEPQGERNQRHRAEAVHRERTSLTATWYSDARDGNSSYFLSPDVLVRGPERTSPVDSELVGTTATRHRS